jgi:thiol:disulfide interchange protein DsbC
MIKKLTALIFALSSASFLFAATPNADEIKEAFPVLTRFNVQIQEVQEGESVYIAKGRIRSPQGAQSILAYITKDMKTIVFGQAFDNEGNKVSIPVNMGQYDKEAAWTYGTGKDKYYVFTDPECPFCQDMETSFKKVDASKGTFYFYLFPLSFHHNANDLSLYILSEQDKKKGAGHTAAIAIADHASTFKKGQAIDYAPITSKLKLTEKQRTAFQKTIDDNVALGAALGVNATPTIYDANGESVNWTALLER